MNEKIIELTDFSFKYKAQQEPTLRDINLTIYKGEKILIVGPSGSGKSTLGQCINGIIPSIYKGDKTGEMRLFGQDAFNMSIYEKSLLVSTVLQDTDGQFIGLSVAEDLAFALENDVTPLAQMKETVADWANRLHLQDLLTHRPQDLSGGQKQRVSLAGVLIDESPILLFDEPLANLDPKSGQETIELIDRLHQEEGVTTIIIEHRLEDVLYRSVDRILLVNDGRIVFDGAPDRLLATNLLAENGIREPLYLTTLRHMGVDFDGLSHLENLEKMTLSALSPLQEQETAPIKEKSLPLLETEKLSVSYAHKQVLQQVDLTIYQGEKLAIVGKNGAGKSTLAKALCNFVSVEGDIRWRGQSIQSDSIKERSERIGYVLQNPNQMISQTMIVDEVALGLRMRGLSEEVIEERVNQVLKVCGLSAFRKWPISALSYGQKKRVTIASILVLDPDIILLDEPTAGQDYQHYTEMMNFLDELNQKGKTIVMITHDMQLMLDYADRAVVMVDGQLICQARPAEVLTDSALLEKANLKETSIFRLAEKLDWNPLVLTDYYMKKEKNHE